MTNIVKTSDGFQWVELPTLKEAADRLGIVFRLYDDGSDALVETLEELEEIYESGGKVYLEGGY